MPSAPRLSDEIIDVLCAKAGIPVKPRPAVVARDGNVIKVRFGG